MLANKCLQDRKETAASRSLLDRPILLASLAAVAIICVWTLIDRIAFDQFSFWDDEGYFILILRHFLKAGGLYVKTYSQYGPFYLLTESSLHRLFGLPVDLDGGRILSVSYILGAAVLLSVFVGRLTRRMAVALLTFILTILITSPMLREPGHPHGIIVSLIALALCLSLLVGTRCEKTSFTLLGAIGGALVLTKINVGVFFCIALALPVVLTLTRSRLRSLLLGLLVAGSFALPPTLMWANLWGWAGSFCIYMLFSLAALYIAVFQSKPDNVLPPMRMGFLMAGFAVATGTILTWALLTGSTPSSLITGIITRPLGQTSLYYLDLHIPAWRLAVLLLPVLGLSAIPLARRRIRDLDTWLAAGKIGIALVVAWCFASDRMVFYSLPLLPVLLCSSGRSSSRLGHVFPRLFLVSLIDFVMLQAYPVVNAPHIALAPAGAWICLMLFDGWSELAVERHSGAWSRPDMFRSPAALALLCLAATPAVLFWYIMSTASQGSGDFIVGQGHIASRQAGERSLLRRYPSLGLPGARLLHLPAAEASIYRRLAGELHANCDMLFTMPGMGSLNVWSETPPPNGFNLTAWMVGFTAPEQLAIKSKMEAADRPCVVYNREMMQIWLRPGIHLDPKAPMVDYVLNDTKAVSTVGAYEIRVPFTREAAWKRPNGVEETGSGLVAQRQ